MDMKNFLLNCGELSDSVVRIQVSLKVKMKNVSRIGGHLETCILERASYEPSIGRNTRVSREQVRKETDTLAICNDGCYLKQNRESETSSMSFNGFSL